MLDIAQNAVQLEVPTSLWRSCKTLLLFNQHGIPSCICCLHTQTHIVRNAQVHAHDIIKSANFPRTKWTQQPLQQMCTWLLYVLHTHIDSCIRCEYSIGITDPNFRHSAPLIHLISQADLRDEKLFLVRCNGAGLQFVATTHFYSKRTKKGSTSTIQNAGIFTLSTSLWKSL